MGQPRRIRRDTFRAENDLAPQSGVKVRILEQKAAMLCEQERTKLIAEICTLIHEGRITEEMRKAGLALIGKLARRMPGEPAHTLGVEELTQLPGAEARRRR